VGGSYWCRGIGGGWGVFAVFSESTKYPQSSPVSDAEHRLRGSDRTNAKHWGGADISYLNKAGCRNVSKSGCILVVLSLKAGLFSQFFECSFIFTAFFKHMYFDDMLLTSGLMWDIL